MGVSVCRGGVCIGYDRRDHIGHTILTEGLYELLVCEILWRLTSPGDTCVDAGANIGQMTGLMAVKAGRDGCVLAFEPHPVLFAELSSNAVEWRKEPDVASIQASQCALSSENTQGRITVSADFATNRGIARLVGAGDEMGSDATACFDVAVHRLDALLPSATQIGVLKVDVEGHELEVFHGSGALLAGHAVRNIVFEDFGGWGSPSVGYLKACGYTVFAVRKSFRGPVLSEWGVKETDSDDPPNYIATTEPERVRAAMAPHGWRVLRKRI